MAQIWDCSRTPSESVTRSWAQDEKLGVRERAQLNQKLDMLGRIGFETAKSMEFLAGTSGDYNHIFKLVVKSQRMLRPMLCRGPQDCASEITLLAGAIEKDDRLRPPDAARQAEGRRAHLTQNATNISSSRIPHERF